MPPPLGSWESIPFWMGLSLLPLASTCCDLIPQAGHLQNSWGQHTTITTYLLYKAIYRGEAVSHFVALDVLTPGEARDTRAQLSTIAAGSAPPSSAGWQGQRWHLPIAGELLLCHLRTECVNWKHDPPLNTQRNGMGDGAQLSRAAFIIHGGREFSHLLGLQASIIDGAAFSDSHQLPLARLGKGEGDADPAAAAAHFYSSASAAGQGRFQECGERAIARPALWQGPEKLSARGATLPLHLPDWRGGRTESAPAGSQASPPFLGKTQGGGESQASRPELAFPMQAGTFLPRHPWTAVSLR